MVDPPKSRCGSICIVERSQLELMTQRSHTIVKINAAMCTKAFLSVLLVSLAIQSGASTVMKNDSIYVLEEELSAYSFSCPPGQLVGLSADRMKMLFYDLEKQKLVMSKDLPLPGQLIQSSMDGKLQVITHDSYVTIVENYEQKTYPVQAINASSIVIVNDLVCITPRIKVDSPSFICFNLKNSSDRWHDCRDSDYGDYQGFVDSAKSWVYTLSGRLSQKFNLSKNGECLESIDYSREGDIHGDQLWFSYDGSRTFLEDGMTLYASDDDNDMQHHGDFNASYKEYYYKYFSQSSIPPYNIAAIRTDHSSTIYYYSWPYLMPIANSTAYIPIPPQARAAVAEEVYMCDVGGKSVTYVLVKYTFLGGTTKTGIILLK